MKKRLNIKIEEVEIDKEMQLNGMYGPCGGACGGPCAYSGACGFGSHTGYGGDDGGSAADNGHGQIHIAMLAGVPYTIPGCIACHAINPAAPPNFNER